MIQIVSSNQNTSCCDYARPLAASDFNDGEIQSAATEVKDECNLPARCLAMKEVGSGMLGDDYFGQLMLGEPEFFGVDKFADSAVIIKGRLKTKPIRQWETGREFLRRVKIAFDDNSIEIPFPHQTVYYGEASKPFDLRVMERTQSQESGRTGTDR